MRENGQIGRTDPRAGFALPAALIWSFCALVAVGALLAYQGTSRRAAEVYLARSECRLAGASAVEHAIACVFRRFTADTGNRALLRQNAFRSFNTLTESVWATAVQDVRAEFPALSELRVRLARAPEIESQRAVVTFCATASRPTSSGSVASSTQAVRVAFGIGRSRVFDHVYFVNNYGWFEGSTITANGDVRANGDMSLSQRPKVNGHVYAAPNEELMVPGDINNDTSGMDSRATYLATQYGTANRTRPISTSSGDGGYEAPEVVTAEDLARRLHPHSELLDMPWISDLNQYVDYSRQLNASLRVGNEVKIAAGAGCYTGLGPSGNATLPDAGALILEGTATSPIRLNGPVVVSNDVVIKGFVTGQGTIYSSRNIHIVGNIQYLNPPSWANKISVTGNATKDLLCLAAKGNIVMGDYTSSSWMDSTLKNCLSRSPYVQQYICSRNEDGSWSDGDIGFPRAGESKFCGNYTVDDGGRKVRETAVYTRDRYGRSVLDHYTYTSEGARKYYESVVAPHEIRSRATTITQIDAVLYNNHGIFGHLGSCTINGSLVCRNEGMIFTDRLYLNWDWRLYSGSPESVLNSLVGMPVSTIAPKILAWQEVPDSWNAEDAHD